MTSHTTTVAPTHDPMPLMLRPFDSSDASSNATNVETRPMPPRNAEAYLVAIFRKNGDSSACATVKTTTAAMNPHADSLTPGTTREATNNPIADEPRNTATRSRKRITG